MRQDVDGLIVDVEEAAEALADGHERPVTGEDMRIELEMPRHVAPSSQQQDLSSRRVLARRLSGASVVHLPFVVVAVVILTLPRSVRRRRRRPGVGVLARRRTQHRLRMARPLVGSERRRATANAGNQPPRKKRVRRGAANEVRGRPPRAERTSSQRRRRRHCIVVALSRVARRSPPSTAAVTATTAAAASSSLPRHRHRRHRQQPSSAHDSASLMVPSPRQPHRSPSHRARTLECVVSANASHSKSRGTAETYDLDLRRRLPAAYAAVAVEDTERHVFWSTNVFQSTSRRRRPSPDVVETSACRSRRVEPRRHGASASWRRGAPPTTTTPADLQRIMDDSGGCDSDDSGELLLP